MSEGELAVADEATEESSIVETPPNEEVEEETLETLETLQEALKKSRWNGMDRGGMEKSMTSKVTSITLPTSVFPPVGMNGLALQDFKNNECYLPLDSACICKFKQENCGQIRKNNQDDGWKISTFERFDDTTS